MNNKGQTFLVTLMLGITIFVLAIAFIQPTNQVSTQAMTDMNCTNVTLTDFDKYSCVFVDITPAYFIGGLLGIIGLIIGARVVFSQ